MAQQTTDGIALTTYIPCSWRPWRSSLVAATCYQFPLSAFYKTAPQNSKTSTTFLRNSQNVSQTECKAHSRTADHLNWSWEHIQTGLVPGLKQWKENEKKGKQRRKTVCLQHLGLVFANILLDHNGLQEIPRAIKSEHLTYGGKNSFNLLIF